MSAKTVYELTKYVKWVGKYKTPTHQCHSVYYPPVWNPFKKYTPLSDKELEDLFVKPEDKPLNERLQTLFSLFPAIDKELKKKRGINIRLLIQHKPIKAAGIETGCLMLYPFKRL